MNEYSKLEELSFLLPIVGVFLFSPALLSVFDIHLTFFGIPFLHIYLFTSWLLLLIASFTITRRLVEPVSPGELGSETEQVDKQDTAAKL